MPKLVKPHKKTRSTCKTCNKVHTKNECRFHNRGSYYKTHVTAKKKLKKKLKISY